MQSWTDHEWTRATLDWIEPFAAALGLQPLELVLIVAMIALAGLLRWLQQRTIIAFVVGMPGLWLHEFMHWLTAALLLARPGALRVAPMRTADGYYAFGSLRLHRAHSLNILPVMLAPLLLLVPAVLLASVALSAAHTPGNPWYWIAGGAATILLANAVPSIHDLRLARHGLIAVPLYALLIGAFLYLDVFEWLYAWVPVDELQTFFASFLPR